MVLPRNMKQLNTGVISKISMSTFFTSEIIVIDSSGKVTKMTVGRAKALAKEQGLDLVEISKQDGLSLCKIIDEGKWMYEQKKKCKLQPHIHVKEMKFKIRIDTHDFDTKINHIRRFLEKGYDVRIVVELHGRERAHPESAQDKMKQILDSLTGLIKPEEIKKSGSNVTVTVHPSKRGSNDRRNIDSDTEKEATQNDVASN